MKIASKTKASTLLVIAFLCSVFSSIGQENPKTKMVKLYTNFSLTETSSNIGFDTSGRTSVVAKNQDIQLGYFSPAFAFAMPNGNFHEFEISNILINNTKNETEFIVGNSGTAISGSILKKTQNKIAVRYEYDFLFFKKKTEAKLRSYLGLSVNPYFSNTQYSSNIPAAFPTSQSSIGALITVIPRLNYNINERWFLDLNIPINIIDLNLVNDKAENPQLTAAQRSITTFNFAQMPSQFLVRFGVGFRV